MLRLRGIIYLALSSWIIWHEYGTPLSGNEWTPKLEKWAATMPNWESAILLGMTAAYIIVMVYWFKGLSLTFIMGSLSSEEYRQTPWGNVNWRIRWSDLLGGSGSGESLDNIDRVLRYRESKFQNMSNDVRAEEYKKTAWLDSYASSDLPNMRKTVKYINSKMQNMSNETAYKWVKDFKTK